ncbi:glutaredoxin 2, C-terminal domain protein [Bacteriovorax sp. Seq25_V]|nr:glutaredoxin 2, C-terminal domain protein [Bacteriovorax sp. Seq25_V]
MALGFLDMPYESIVTQYNDEKTPIDLTGKKMLPIMEFDNEAAMNESLDIIKKLDSKALISFDLYKNHEAEIEDLLSKIGSDVHSLCMPYWIWTPEFTTESRKYFQEKKEVKRGPFKNLIKNKEQFIDSLNETLKTLEERVSSFYRSDILTVADIMIASHLWGMYIFPEYQFSEKVHSYLQLVKKQCRFDYHVDFWK